MFSVAPKACFLETLLLVANNIKFQRSTHPYECCYADEITQMHMHCQWYMLESSSLHCSVCILSCHAEIYFKYEYGNRATNDKEQVMGSTYKEKKRLTS